MPDRLVLHDGLPSSVEQGYRAARRAVGAALRRRLNRGGIDPVLSRVHLPYEVMAYFADPPVNLYQVRQWLYPLERLDETHPVFVLTRNTRSFQALVGETHLPVVNARRIGLLDSIAQHSDVKLALYVNQYVRNFQAIRYPDMLHVFLSHGESEKGTYMATNQAKAYDFTFVAGDAAVERISANLIGFDPAARLRKVGRPQLDEPRPAAEPHAGGRTTVLYAPTWEGDRPSMSYGSVQTHGEAVVEALTSSGRHRIVYRPHPRTGINVPEAGTADQALRARVAQAARADPAAGHRVDLTPHFGPQIQEADVMICDVSAVALDFLPTGKPLVVTVPVSPDAIFDRRTFLGSVYQLPVTPPGELLALLDQWTADDSAAAERKRWIEYYYGDITPGASLQRFLDACSEVIGLRDQLVEAKRQRYGRAEDEHGAGVPPPEDIDDEPTQ